MPGREKSVIVASKSAGPNFDGRTRQGRVRFAVLKSWTRFTVCLLCLLLATLPAEAAAKKSKRSRKVRRPAPAPAIPWPAHVSTIVIDAGHGGHDRGGIPFQRIGEKDMTLDVARRLSGELQRAGFRTVLTRRDDTFISLPERVAISNAQHEAVFVSIHFNAAFREGAHGFETHYCAASAARLAASIQSNLIHATRTENRGVKHATFYVLRNARIPAVLVECGFLTNRDEGNLTLKPSHRARMAGLIARGIIARCRD